VKRRVKMMNKSGGAEMSKWPFTVSQWQELEHQALIYKYMVAGLPVPPDLVIPIQNSFHSISQTFLNHPSSACESTYSYISNSPTFHIPHSFVSVLILSFSFVVD